MLVAIVDRAENFTQRQFNLFFHLVWNVKNVFAFFVLVLVIALYVKIELVKYTEFKYKVDFQG